MEQEDHVNISESNSNALGHVVSGEESESEEEVVHVDGHDCLAEQIIGGAVGKQQEENDNQEQQEQKKDETEGHSPFDTRTSECYRDCSFWKKDESSAKHEVDGVTKWYTAFESHLNPALQDTIGKLDEVIENQKHLLESLQHHQMKASAEFKHVDHTMSRLPEYLAKIQDMQLFMATLPPRLQKLTKRTHHLQVEAQSRALAREEQQDSKTQWNKLYAVKPAAGMHEHYPTSGRNENKKADSKSDTVKL